MMSFLYRALYTTLVTALVPFALFKITVRNITDNSGQRKAGSRLRLLERFGYLITERPASDGIVFHAVSVGESMTAIKLIRRYREEHPQMPITVTCATASASNIITQQLGDAVTHCYLPYDQPVFVALFLKQVRPKVLVIVETELWPNLTQACYARGIELALLNARLSKKSFDGYTQFSPLTRPLLKRFAKVCCQTERDAQRFLALGLDKTKCSVTGNLKFDIDLDDAVVREAQAMASDIFGGRACWIGASTHEGEEAVLLDAQQRLRQRFPDLVLIIAPRRPQRTQRVAELAAQRSLTFVRRTEHRHIAAQESVFILDTIGELMCFYAVSQVCFVGGSLGGTGGHNPLEPAILAKPILSGEQVDNFTLIYDELSDADAVRFVGDVTSIVEQVTAFLDDRLLAEQYGNNAKSYVERNRGATRKSLQIIEELTGFAAK